MTSCFKLDRTKGFSVKKVQEKKSFEMCVKKEVRNFFINNIAIAFFLEFKVEIG